jgi:leader peptidase (prepilin peptidase)/N-methyltransferase
MEEASLILLGLIVGSFLNVVIYRLPLKKSIVFPRSSCTRCNAPIKFYDNIPVLSYLILRGRCRNCREKFSLQYPFVEALTAFSFWFCYRMFGHSPLYMGFAIAFICLLIALALIDLKHMILPDELTLGGGLVFLVYAFFNPEISFWDGLGSALGGALVFAGIYFFYLKVRKIEGLGFGDVKMMILLGAFLGLKKLVIAILVGSVLGLVVGLYFIVFRKKDLRLQLPFGTFLGLGSTISLFWGNEILMFLHTLYG